MANTIGWGKATQNNDNGFGKYQNTIGAASIYAESYAGETALVGTSAAFSYSASTFTQADADPTPTITGTTGGTFNASSGLVFVDTGTFNSSTGQIDLSASTIDSHIITYTVDGVQSGQTVGITAAPYSSTKSFSFDGTNDYFDAGSASYLNGLSEFTLSCWFKLDTATNLKTIISDWNYNSNPFGHFALQTEDASGSTFGLTLFIKQPSDAGNNVVKTGGGVFNENVWYNVIFTYNAGTVTCYKNGTSVSLTTIGTIPTTLTSQNGNLNIGKFGGSLTRYWNGNIDEVSLWDSALSSDAVTEIAAGPNDLESLTNASSSNLVAWYKMGE